MTSATNPSCALGDPGFAERYRAIDARDARFDGQFFTGVLSTGIYCRPSCPARTPKPENVVFFRTSAAAHESGLRACKRCLPEATPGSPEWRLRQDAAGRAMRLIDDGLVDREGVDGLARRLSVTSRHLRRLLIAELGATPLALARARRAQAARALLVRTDLPIAQLAFAAGFGSVRQCNDTVREVFGVTPSDLRERRTSSNAPAALADAVAASPAQRIRLDIELPVRAPFDARGTFSWLADRAIAGLEVVDLEGPVLRYARIFELPAGPAVAEVRAHPRGDHEWQLTATLELTELADVAPAVARLRRLLDLDADPLAIDTALRDDPALAPLVARVPGIRMPGAVDPAEYVVRAIVGQQISVAAARKHLGRLVELVGEPFTTDIPGLNRRFPSTATIAALPDPPAIGDLDPERPLRLPRRQIATVLAAARALSTGELSLHPGITPSELRGRLLELPGIGQWTAEYLAMRLTGDPDAWPIGDVALLAGARRVGLLGPEPAASDHRVLARRATDWSPWRSYAALHLWRAASEPKDHT